MTHDTSFTDDECLFAT